MFHCFFVVLFRSLSFLLYSRFLSFSFFVVLFSSLGFLLSGFLVVFFRSLSFLLNSFFMRFFVMRFSRRRFSRRSSGGGCSSSRSRCGGVISSKRCSRQTHSGGNNQR